MSERNRQIDSSLKETLDKMEERLKKYRLDQSTPVHRGHDQMSGRDSGFATRQLDDSFDYGRSPRYVSENIPQGRKSTSSLLDDRPEMIRDTPSRNSYMYEGARPKVRFDDDHVAEKHDENWLSDHLSKRMHIEQQSPIPYAPDTYRQTHRDDKEQKLTVKPATYDGSSSWLDYKCHFEACANVNGWNEEKKGLFLALSLRGQAQAVLGDLPTDRGQHYETLVRSLQERFSPPNQTDLYRVQLKERRQKPTETLSELGQSIRRLTNLAYPTAPGEVRETLAKDQFIDALIDSEIRIRIKQSRPVNLNEAISLAVELEAYNRVEKRDRELKGHLRAAFVEEQTDISDIFNNSQLANWMKSVEENMKNITEELRELKVSNQRRPYDNRYRGKDTRSSGTKQDIKCYECKKPGHIRRNCPLLNKRQKQSDDRQESVKRGGKRASEPHVSIGLGSSIEECGLYIDVSIQGEKAKFLVDTGATVTLVSDTLYKKLPASVRPKLHEVNQTIMSANGTALSVHGKAEFNIGIDQLTYHNEAVVANLKADGILGLDFMKRNHCKVDISNEILDVNGQNKRMTVEGSLGCYRITAAKTVSIPPRSEIIVPGKVCVPEGSSLPYCESIVEPVDKSNKQHSTLTARTVVNVQETVPVRLLNIDQESKVVHSGTVIGQLAEIDTVQESRVNKTPSSNGVLRKDLADLLKKLN